MKRLSRLIVVLCSALLVYVFTLPTFADWVQDGTEWKYQNTTGEFVQGDFKQIGGLWYYFDDDYHMVKGCVEIEGEYYLFTEDGPADTDGAIIFDEEYKTTLKGKILKQDDLVEYEPEEINQYFIKRAAMLEESGLKQQARLQNLANTNLRNTSGEETRESWNKIGNEFRYVYSGENTANGFVGSKYAREYVTAFLPNMKANTVYYDDKGNARPLNWKLQEDGTLKLVIPEGEAECALDEVNICGGRYKYSFTNKSLTVDSVNDAKIKGFNPDTYATQIIADFQKAYEKSLADEEAEKAKKIQESQQAVLDKLKREQANLEYANRLQMSGSTQSTQTFYWYDENADKDVAVRVNIRVPQFIGNNSEKVNATVASKYAQLVTSEIQSYCDELTSCPKSVSVPDPSVSVDDNNLVRMYINASTYSFYIYYDIAADNMYIGD